MRIFINFRDNLFIVYYGSSLFLKPDNYWQTVWKFLIIFLLKQIIQVASRFFFQV